MGRQPVKKMTKIHPRHSEEGHRKAGFKQLILACLVIIGTAVVSLPGGYALAGGEGSGLSELKAKYCQKEFLRLSQGEISKLNDRYHLNNKKTKICEYSANMSTHLVDMADYDRRATFRLMKDMAKLKSKKNRKAWLKNELAKQRKFVKTLKASIKRLEAKNSTRATRLAIRSEKLRLERTESFIEGLEIWVKFPHEGTNPK